MVRKCLYTATTDRKGWILLDETQAGPLSSISKVRYCPPAIGDDRQRASNARRGEKEKKVKTPDPEDLKNE